MTDRLLCEDTETVEEWEQFDNVLAPGSTDKTQPVVNSTDTEKMTDRLLFDRNTFVCGCNVTEIDPR